MPCVSLFDEVALARRECCGSNENVALGDFDVGYAPLYIFQNSSNPTLKNVCILLYINDTSIKLKEKIDPFRKIF